MNKERVSSGMDKVGKELHHHSCIFNIGQWAPRGRVDSPTKGREAGMPACTPIICSGSGHTCHMHYVSMFTRPIERIPNTKLSR